MSQQQTTELLNNLVAQINAKINCGPSCQKEKKIEELKKKYELAEQTVKNAPENLAEARNNYYSFAYGNKYFTEMQRVTATNEVDNILKKKKKETDDASSKIKDLLNDYDLLSVNLDNSKILLEKLKNENKKYLKKIDEEVSTTNTSDRKAYYEEQYVSTVENYLYWMKKIYWFAFVIYVILFLYLGFYKKRQNFLLLFFLALFPYVINTGLHKIFTIWSHGF